MLLQDLKKFWDNWKKRPRLRDLESPVWRRVFSGLWRSEIYGLGSFFNEKIAKAPFSISQVDRVIALGERKYEWENCLAVVHLKDGRYAFVRGDCFLSDLWVEATVSGSLQWLIRFGLNEFERRQLNLLVPEDPNGYPIKNK